MGTYGKSPEMVRAIVEDRRDQALVEPAHHDGDTEGTWRPEPTELSLRLTFALSEYGARLAGGEVPEGSGLTDVCLELEDIIAERLMTWAVAFSLGETRQAA